MSAIHRIMSIRLHQSSPAKIACIVKALNISRVVLMSQYVISPLISTSMTRKGVISMASTVQHEVGLRTDAVCALAVSEV